MSAESGFKMYTLSRQRTHMSDSKASGKRNKTRFSNKRKRIRRSNKKEKNKRKKSKRKKGNNPERKESKKWKKKRKGKRKKKMKKIPISLFNPNLTQIYCQKVKSSTITRSNIP